MKMSECVITRKSKCQERSGQGPGHRKMYKVWAPCGKVRLQARERLRGPGNHVGAMLGWAGACRMKQWEIPCCIPILGFSFLKFLFLYDNFNYAHFCEQLL